MTKPLKVLDCFSGIGGFALAESFYEGQFETKQFVEINPYCQQVLSKNFKGVPIHDDIKTFTAPRRDHSKSVPSVFPVKISQSLALKEASQEKLDQDYFTSAFGYLGKFDLNSPSLKTLEIYSPLKKGKYSKKFSFKLPKQGMMWNGQLFQQEMWEAATFENVCGSYATLATPTTLDHLPQRGLRFNGKTNSGYIRKGRTKLLQSEGTSKSTSSERLFNELQQTQTSNSNHAGIGRIRETT